MKLNLENKAVQWVTLILLAIIWGSSFILIRKSLDFYTVEDVAAFRIFIAWLVMMPFVLKGIQSLRQKYVIPLIVTGLLGTAIPAVLFAKAQTVIDSSLAGVLNSLVPLFALILGVTFFKIKVRRTQAAGVVLGFAGAVGLFLLAGVNLGGKPAYGLLVVGAALCYAISVNVIKVFLREMNSIHITALSLVFLGPPAAAYLVFAEFPQRAMRIDQGWLGVIYLCILGIFSSALAIVLFNMLIKRTSTLFATSVTYLIPIVAIIWGIWAGEQFGLVQFGLFALILSGVYLVNRPEKAKKE